MKPNPVEVERSAQESEEKFRKIFLGSLDCITINSPDGRYIEVNDEWSRTTGFRPEEAVGKTPVELGIIADQKLFDDFLKRIQSENEVRNQEIKFKTKAGFSRTALLSALTMKLGSKLRILFFARDITDRNQALAAQALLASLVESSDDAIGSATLDGILTSWNPAAKRLYGYSAAEVVGRPLTAFLTPAQLTEPQKAIAWVAQGKGVYRYESRRRRKDGTQADMGVIVSPIRDAHRTIVGVSAIARDITERKRAERELQENEQKFKKVFAEGLSAITLNLLSDGTYVDVNPEFERLFGYSREEVIGKTPTELGLWADRGELIAALKDLKAKGVIHNREVEYRAKGGELIPCLYSWTLTELGGEPCVIAFARDIRELKQAREVLRGEQESLSAMLATQNDIAHAELDLNAVMKVIVERAQKLTHAGGAQIDLIDDSQMVCRASSGNRAGQLGTRLDIRDGLSGASIASGKVIRCDDARPGSCTECEPHHLDGQRSALFAPLKDDGEVIGVLKVFAPEPYFFSDRDLDALQLMAGFAAGAISHAADFEAKRALLAERTSALAALRESEERFRKVFEEGHIGMCVLSADAGFVSVNEALCRMLGYSREELEHLSLADVTHPDDFENDRQLFQKLIAGEIPHYKLEKRDLTKTGKTVWVSVSASAIRDGNGNVYTLGIIEDINERVLAARELAESRRALIHQERLRAIGELASGVAHDFNNTLNAMQLRLAILGADPECQERHATDLATLSRIVRDASETIGRLQDFAQQRHDRPLESVDLERVIREAIDMAHSSVEERPSLFGVPIRVDSAVPNLPPVVGSPAELRQVFVNLLLNACDAMRTAGGAIRIEAETRDGTAIVKVADEGVGIPEEHLDRVFEPFFTTKGQKGSGLGLSIAYGVMTRLGGAISAANRAEGGAVFTLTLPLSARLPDGPTVAQPIVEIPSRRILVIDDDIDNLKAIQSLLELKGHQVEASLSGADALDRFQAGASYDVVLCDLGMPDMNGWETAQAIRELAPATEVYILTGWAQKIPEHEPRRKLVKDVLAKPVDTQRLDTILANVNGAPSAR